MSSTSNRFELIEISRGIAALLVVFFHTSAILGLPKYFGRTPLKSVFSFGYAGVDFFFVLSGFIIFYSTTKNHGNTAAIFSYIKHRLIRIYPIYWTVSLILLPLTYLMGHHVGLDNAVLDFLLVPHQDYPFVIVAWTLRYEMLFYISFILFFLNTTLAWIYFLLWGSGIVVVNLLNLNFTSPLTALYLNDHNLEFLLGIGIAQYSKSNLQLLLKPSLLIFGGAFIFISSGLNESLIHIGGYTEYKHYHLLYGVGAVLMIGGVIRLQTNLSNYWTKVGAFLGKASYSIYLIHFAVLSATIKLLMFFHLPLWLDMLLLVLSGIFIGSLLYQYIERPMLAMIRGRVVKNHE